MKKILLFTIICAFEWVHAAVDVVNVRCQQRWPWNGLVDIDYEIISDNQNTTYFVYPIGFDAKNQKSILMESLSGAGIDFSIGAGKHRITWDSKDAIAKTNKSNLRFFEITDEFKIQLIVLDFTKEYLVIDLSEEKKATFYPITTMDSPPMEGWSNEYKGNKLVLKLIRPGTFMMGTQELPFLHPSHSHLWEEEIYHEVKITQPFYIGIFEVTQRQWELVIGDNVSFFKNDFRPLENISHDDMVYGDLDINGSYHRTGEDYNYTGFDFSFLKALRAKTGLRFDLPTEAQWEYACRAGTTSHLNNGENLESPRCGQCETILINDHFWEFTGKWYGDGVFREADPTCARCLSDRHAHIIQHFIRAC